MKSFSAIQDLGPLFWGSAIMKSFWAGPVFLKWFLRVSGRHISFLEKGRYLKPEASTFPGSPNRLFSGCLFSINSFLKLYDSIGESYPERGYLTEASGHTLIPLSGGPL